MARRDGAPQPDAHRPVRPASESTAPDAGPLEVERLERMIHERVRLAIVSVLAVHDRLSFNDLKGLLRATDGNLSTHARKLEEAGYVAVLKSFNGRTPRTEFRLTTAGRKALERYLTHMEALIRATRAG